MNNENFKYISKKKLSSITTNRYGTKKFNDEKNKNIMFRFSNKLNLKFKN